MLLILIKSTTAIALGFSAGVMIYVSLIEIFNKEKDSLVAEFGLKLGSWVIVSAFFYGEAHLSIYGLITGMIVIAISLLLFI